ncbi:MAG: four helix bundle protein [Bacteroidetes bacterium]|nr:four helix bundle protein [Bacteroidota bacterium]
MHNCNFYRTNAHFKFKRKWEVQRTEQFSLRVMNLVENLPQRKSINVISNQILRSATSVGANYRSARRAKSNRDREKYDVQRTNDKRMWEVQSSKDEQRLANPSLCTLYIRNS